MSTYAEQLAILLTIKPADPNFIEKIRQPYANLTETFAQESISLSRGVLTLLGFLPGDWLDQVPKSVDVFLKLHKEWNIYHSIKEAIRAKKIPAHLEGLIYYIRPIALAEWFRKNKLDMHLSITKFLQSQIGPKKRGAKEKGSEQITKAAEYYKNKNIRHVTFSILEKDKNPHIQSLIREFITYGSGEEKRRIKKFSEKINPVLDLLFQEISH